MGRNGEPHHAAGVAWLERRLDFDAFGMRELVGESSATSSRSDKGAARRSSPRARAALLAHAGGLQALFKLYESDGDVEMRDVDKMNLEQFRRFMVDAKAIEFGPQTITAADVDSCFNEALKRKGGEKEQKGVAKTLDAVAFLVAVFRVAATKYDLAVIKAPDVGFAELHRRLDHFVEAHVREFLCGAFEGMHEDLARAFADEDARAEMQKAQRLIAQTTKMCMPRRPPGAEWSVYVHDLTKNATEWGVLGDDADDASSPDASKTLSRHATRARSPCEEVHGEHSGGGRRRARERRRRARGGVRPGRAGARGLCAYAQAVIDVTQNVGDFKLFKPEECPARLTAAQFEKLLLALAWLQHGKRVARAKRAEEAAEAARAEAEARRRRELAAGEGDESDASSSDSEKGTAKARRRAARGAEAPETAKPAHSEYATPSFAEHLRAFLVDVFHKTGVLAELSEDEPEEPDSDGDPEDWSDEERSETGVSATRACFRVRYFKGTVPLGSKIYPYHHVKPRNTVQGAPAFSNPVPRARPSLARPPASAARRVAGGRRAPRKTVSACATMSAWLTPRTSASEARPSSHTALCTNVALSRNWKCPAPASSTPQLSPLAARESQSSWPPPARSRRRARRPPPAAAAYSERRRARASPRARTGSPRPAARRRCCPPGPGGTPRARASSSASSVEILPPREWPIEVPPPRRVRRRRCPRAAPEARPTAPSR